MSKCLHAVMLRRICGACFFLFAWLSAGAAAGEPLRVLPPERWAAMSPWASCVAEVLYERLGECGGVDIVGGDRARQVLTHLGTGAYELTDAQRWNRLRNYVDIDAMITITDLPAQTTEKQAEAGFEVRIYRADGVTSFKAAIAGPGAEPPKAVAAVLHRIAQELKLNESDTRRLAEIRVDDASSFNFYYTSRVGRSNWPVNPYVTYVMSFPSLRGNKHWSVDAAIVRVVADYLSFGMHGRQSDKLKEAQPLVRPALLRLLGTEHESEAYPLMRIERLPLSEPLLSDIESVLLQIAQPLVNAKPGVAPSTAKPPAAKPVKKSPRRDAAAEIDELDDVIKPDKRDMQDAMDKPTELGVLAGQNSFSPDQRLGALRMLGVMASARAEPMLIAAAASADAKVRQIAASGLGDYKNDDSVVELTTLAGDADELVAFTAARSLALRNRAPVDMRRRATAMLDKPEPYRAWAALWLASDAGKGDDALNAKLAADPSPAVRSALRKALAAKAAGTPEQLARVMRDSDTSSVVAAILGLPRESIVPGNETYARLVRLANDPAAFVASAARDALATHRPQDPRARANFDLAVAAPYIRQRTIISLRNSKEPWARAELATACGNDDPHTRVDALAALAQIDPAAARPLALAALNDAHLFVRFNAAALLPGIADVSMVQPIREALPRQKDKATALYLADALAKVGGGPPPPPQPAANQFTGDETIVMIFGSGGVDPDSPYRFCFKPSHGNHVRDDAISDEVKKAHDRGIVFAYNIGINGDPGVAMVDGATQDNFWIYLDDQLDTPALPYIDMLDLSHGGPQPDALWRPGWRFFCEETGIDPARIVGDKTKLTAVETHAWNTWATRRCIEGRNKVHDYFKLKFGRLHPGVRLSASVGGVVDPVCMDWKFDVSFVRGGQRGDSRQEIYTAIRRNKTLWPDRPVFWVGEGFEIPDLWIIKYDSKLPADPLVGRHYRAYTDALTAWMAGANPGWAGMIVLRTVNWGGENDYSGYVLGPENIKPDGAKVRAAIEYAFKGAEPYIRDKADMAKAHRKEPGLGASEKDAKIDALVDVIDKPDPDADIASRLAQDKERMFLGIKFLGKHMIDLAHLFASLPRANPAPEALVISSRETSSAGEDLLESFDVLPDVNYAERVDLKRYRMITVSDPAVLTDATIDRVTRWLRETPGVLYVHVDLTGDNARQAGTPRVVDGKLMRDWPWESDVVASAGKADGAKGKSLELASAAGETVTLSGASVARTYKVGGAAQALRTVAGEPALVTWKHPDFKGVVVFDGINGGGQPYREVVRGALAELHKSLGVGVVIEGPGLYESLTDARWIARTSNGGATRAGVRGADLLTGALNPSVGPQRSAAFVGREFQGRYAASFNGVSVLCESPIRKVEKIPGGLRIECDGLIQASSDTGKAEVTPASGALPPAVAQEKARRWIYAETSEGIATQTVAEGEGSQPGTVVFVRCARPLQILAK